MMRQNAEGKIGEDSDAEEVHEYENEKVKRTRK